MRETVQRLWPEIAWIENPQLREQVTETWAKALERSPLKPDDLNQIPFTLLVPNCPITFMEHKRCVVHIAPGQRPGHAGVHGTRVADRCGHSYCGSNPR